MKRTSTLYNAHQENPGNFVWNHTSEEVQKLRAYLVDMKADTEELDYMIEVHKQFSTMSIEQLMEGWEASL